ncbi:MAG: hypothetical protein NDI61_10860, partial [Bdellovibrionaceae bacterium]|nr:hypothetical protein [Pseudobdellovibrionaceae bacterium]
MSRRLARLDLFLALSIPVSVLTCLTPLNAEATRFRNSYVSFELPNRWSCQLIDTEWVCRNGEPGDKTKEAVIILTAKEVGPSDSLQAYEAHLKTPRTLPSALGTPTQSQILNVTQRKINNHPWIDGMHLNSEVRDYYTRYVATTKDRIAILVTFSAHKAYYSRYTNDFFRAIESLQVLNTRALFQSAGQGGDGIGGAGGGMIGIDPNIAMGGDLGEELPE